MNSLPEICLNMIVKDEAHLIKETLTKLVKAIKIDYWVISDTGSIDKTKEIITEFFKNLGTPGELVEHPWKDFGYNRTAALVAAKGKSKYILIFDADDHFVGKPVLPKIMKHDGYFLNFGSEMCSYKRLAMVRNDKPGLDWKYLGVLHEYIATASGIQYSADNINGDYYIVSGKSGNRSKNENKYLNDAKILEKGYYEAKESGDNLFNRYVYYCANSYFDANQIDDSIKWYLLTLESNGWSEERYNSCLRLYDLYTRKNDPITGVYYLVKSFNYNSRRVEGIYELVKYYSIKQEHHVAYNYYQLIKDYFENEYLTDNLANKLFARTMDYSFFLPYYLIIVSGYVNKHQTGVKMYQIIFEKMTSPGPWWLNNLIFNFQFYIEHLPKNIRNRFFKKFKKYFRNFEFDTDGSKVSIYNQHRQLIEGYSRWGLVYFSE